MARVTVRLYADLRAATGKNEVEIEATSVKGLIEALVRRFGTDLRESLLDQRGRLEQFYRVYLNKRRVSESEMEKTLLRDGDLVQIFPPVAGGFHIEQLEFTQTGRAWISRLIGGRSFEPLRLY